MDRSSVIAKLARHTGHPDPDGVTIFTDTSDFFAINSGDVVVLKERAFLVGNNTREGRFGLDEEVKHWVKRARDLDDGSAKVLKLTFHETFEADIGGVRFQCFRSPRKESRILELMAEHPNFMHGVWYNDTAGNNVRVLDFIRGKPLADRVEAMDMDHETYFHGPLPGILDGFLECCRGIALLHANGEKHGDIRRDHILVDIADGRYRWIDFDYNYRHHENIYAYDLFGLGNILTFLVGKGDVHPAAVRDETPDVFETLYWEDLNVVFQNRVGNLRKIYPYVPEALNRVLLHFCNGAKAHYETTDQFVEELAEAREGLGR